MQAYHHLFSAISGGSLGGDNLNCVSAVVSLTPKKRGETPGAAARLIHLTGHWVDLSGRWIYLLIRIVTGHRVNSFSQFQGVFLQRGVLESAICYPPADQIRSLTEEIKLVNSTNGAHFSSGRRRASERA